MKKFQLLTILALVGLVAMTSCKKEGCTDPAAINYNDKAKKDDGSCQYDNAPKDVEEISGNITGTVNWTKDKVYRLNGFVRVQDGGVLNIEEGTLIIGDTESKGTLVVQMGGKINAIGMEDEPIIFTSEKAPGLRQPGDWGGVVICGRAPNNVAGGQAELEGGYGAFHGGSDPNDNSGTLKYVQINFAGVPINPNEEVNSLTMGSVGAGTTIEYVICAYGLDDAFEWFGGTVNAKHLIAYRGLDDDFDVDLGFSGNVQFALGIRDRSLADQSGSNGFEVDNDGSGSTNTPYTSAIFSNVTIIGPKKDRETPISLQFQHGGQLRRASRIQIHNSFVTGYPYGFYIDGSASTNAAINNELQIRNTILSGVEHWGGNGFGSAGTVFPGAPANGAQHPNNPRGTALRSNVDSVAGQPFGMAGLTTWFETASFNNQLMAKWQDAGVDPTIFDVGPAPKLTPNAGSILLSGAGFSGLPTFFEQVSYRGAFGATNWAEGWADFNCIATQYDF